MSTTRKTVAGLLSLALTIVPGVAAAQSAATADPETPAATTVTETGVQEIAVAGAAQGFRSTLQADDARVSGESTVIFNVQTSIADGVGRATALVRIVNDGGSWVGPVDGVYYPDGSEFRLGLLEGGGGYEGLMLSMTYDGPRGAGNPFRGLIWEGEPPPAPDPELLPE